MVLVICCILNFTHFYNGFINVLNTDILVVHVYNCCLIFFLFNLYIIVQCVLHVLYTISIDWTYIYFFPIYFYLTRYNTGVLEC